MQKQIYWTLHVIHGQKGNIFEIEDKKRFLELLENMGPETVGGIWCARSVSCLSE